MVILIYCQVQAIKTVMMMALRLLVAGPVRHSNLRLQLFLR
jgi:hypothetical protein